MKKTCTAGLRYTGRGDMESISSRCCRDYYERIHPPGVTQPWRPQVPIPDEDYEALLREQRTDLDRWYAALPPTHLPHESLGSKNSARGPLQLGQPPLRKKQSSPISVSPYFWGPGASLIVGDRDIPGFSISKRAMANIHQMTTFALPRLWKSRVALPST
jgi:hypothetical protein